MTCLVVNGLHMACKRLHAPHVKCSQAGTVCVGFSGRARSVGVGSEPLHGR